MRLHTALYTAQPLARLSRACCSSACMRASNLTFKFYQPTIKTAFTFQPCMLKAFRPACGLSNQRVPLTILNTRRRITGETIQAYSALPQLSGSAVTLCTKNRHAADGNFVPSSGHTM
jgi:hypothetical protein